MLFLRWDYEEFEAIIHCSNFNLFIMKKLSKVNLLKNAEILTEEEMTLVTGGYEGEGSLQAWECTCLTGAGSFTCYTRGDIDYCIEAGLVCGDRYSYNYTCRPATWF